MPFEIKIQNKRQLNIPALFSDYRANQKWHLIRRKSGAKRKLTGSTAHFIEKRVFSEKIPVRGKRLFRLDFRRFRRFNRCFFSFLNIEFLSSIHRALLSDYEMVNSMVSFGLAQEFSNAINFDR